MLPFPVAYPPSTVPSVVNMLQLLLFSDLAFFLMLPLMGRTLTITLDFDWLYRKLGNSFVRGLDRASKAQQGFEMAARARLGNVVRVGLHHFGPKGAFAATPQIGRMALWMLVLLLTALALNFF